MEKAFCAEDAAHPATWFLTEGNLQGRVGDVLHANKRNFSAGTTVKLDGEDSTVTYFVLSGWLCVSKSLEDGQRQIIDFILPGEILDPRSSDGSTSMVQIEAMTFTEVSTIPAGSWAELRRDFPEVRRAEARNNASTLSRLTERMLRLGKGSAENRISYALIELCVRLRAIGQVSNCEFHLPLNQQDLGDFLGLSSVHVCRTLRRLSRKEIISTEDHMNIRIHDMAALSEIAGIDPFTLESEIIPHAE